MMAASVRSFSSICADISSRSALLNAFFRALISCLSSFFLLSIQWGLASKFLRTGQPRRALAYAVVILTASYGHLVGLHLFLCRLWLLWEGGVTPEHIDSCRDNRVVAIDVLVPCLLVEQIGRASCRERV